MNIMSGRRRGAGASLLRGGLTLASLPYAGAMRLRRWMYRCGLRDRKHAAAPVICVGNLTTGGTGKTPMVAWVVRRLKEADAAPAILTRGYKTAVGLSDEAELLKRLCDVPVIVDPDRVAGAKTAVASGADVLVMDDGFQHLRLHRDLDIVLIDATRPFGFGYCLPRGLLREPCSALRYAHAVVITHSDMEDPDTLENLRDRLGRLAPAASLHSAVHKPSRIIDENGADMPLDALAGRKVLAFCGLANPDHFFETLLRLNVRMMACRVLNDHVEYTDELLAGLRSLVEKHNPDVLVTTQKDQVKLSAASLGRPIWTLAIEIEIVEGEAELIRKVAFTARED